jgi:O-antigen/teichoic acid export membrane protein
VLYARISNNNDADAGRLLTIRLIKFTFVITFLCLLPLLLIPTDVYAAIFDGHEFGEIKSVFLYLAIGTVMFSASAMLSAYMSGTGQFQVNTRASLIGLIATVALGFWLIPTYGMLGAGFTASASYLVTVLYQGYEFCKRSGTNLGEFMPKQHDFQSVQDEIQAFLVRGKYKL